MGLPCSDLPSPRLAFLFGASAGAGACALPSASSTGYTLGTGAPPDTLLIGPVMSLFSLTGGLGVLFGFTSITSMLASLDARFWRSPGAPSTGIPQALALSVALSPDGVSGGGALLRRSFSPTCVVPPVLLFWQATPTLKKHKNSNLLIEALAPKIFDRFISLMESRWEDGSYTGELVLC